MGKQSRIKKYRNQIAKKLEAMGLKNETKLVPTGKVKPMISFKMDENGKPVLNEQGEPMFEQVTVNQTQLSNPYKSTIRKLLKEEEAVIKQFLKQ